MRHVLERRLASFYSSLPGNAWTVLPRAPARQELSGLDIALVCLFLIGIYTNFTIAVSTKVPFPSVPSGVAGLLLLWRRREAITQRGFTCLLSVVLLFLVATLWASDVGYLPRRTNGLIQLTYSLVIGYSLFLTVQLATPRQFAGLFLGFALVILAGCLLEDYGGLRPISDAVRNALYHRGVYENDLRDILLYKRIRPKLFASEPSSVTFCFTLFTFLWFVTSNWRWKLPLYVALFAVGSFAMPGPTLLLMLALIPPYAITLASRQGGRLTFLRTAGGVALTALTLVAFIVLAKAIFPERLKQIVAGNDPSFFYRVQGPALAAASVLHHYPIAGAGLTGEPFIEREVVNIYVGSPSYSERWQVVTPATELLINYFWLHWIYLGLIWGGIMLAALTVWLLKLGVPSPAFVWLSWAVLGQASGAYVGPSCWAVFFLTAAAALLHQRSAQLRDQDTGQHLPTLPVLGRRLTNIRHLQAG
jgi:hypothetical protein